MCEEASFPAEDGAAGEGLFEVVGDHVGEEFPEAAPERIGAGELAAGGVEGDVGMEEALASRALRRMRLAGRLALPFYLARRAICF